MILINLLPHREEARRRRKESFYVSLAAAAIFGAVIAGGAFLVLQTQISTQQSRNSFLQQQNASLDNQIKDIANLQAEIASLRARQQAVEDLQADRNLPVYLLNEMVSQLPDGVYVTAIRQNGPVVQLTGVAQSNERVSELLRNLANNSQFLTRPELVEIVAGNVNVSARDSRRVANFNMRVSLKRAEAPKPGTPAKP